MKTNNILIFLIAGILFVIFSPFIFTRPFGVFNFTDTGTIGDTIGGITAPITSLLGSILVYFALKAQIDANKLIQDQIEGQKNEELIRKKNQYLSEQINIVRMDINEFTYTYKESSTSSDSNIKQKFNYSGSDAIYEFIKSLPRYGNHDDTEHLKNPKLIELISLMQIINSLFDKIENSEISLDDKNFFKSLLDYQFSSKIKPAFIANEKFKDSNVEICKSCGKKHGIIPSELFDLVDEIIRKNKVA
jgi:hypothetical protein